MRTFWELDKQQRLYPALRPFKPYKLVSGLAPLNLVSTRAAGYWRKHGFY